MKKQPKQIGQSAYVVIDTDGRVVWGFCHRNKRVVYVWANHAGRQIARVEVVEIVRKAKKAKESKR